ncbi:MAG: hypothetical protein H6918_01280 [Sphingomonadaceae bacterium]|nr:hypothetical protein [Sphingomonadaceae bacterium]
MMTQTPPSLLAKLFATIQPAAGEGVTLPSPASEKPAIPGFSAALAKLAVAKQVVAAEESANPELPHPPGLGGKALPQPASTGKHLPPVAAPALKSEAQPSLVPVMRPAPGVVVPPKTPIAPPPELVPVSKPLRGAKLAKPEPHPVSDPMAVGKLATKPADQPMPVSRYIKSERKPLETLPIMEREKSTDQPHAPSVQLVAPSLREQDVRPDLPRPTSQLEQPVTFPETDLASEAVLLPVNLAPAPTLPASVPVAEPELGKGQKAESPAPAPTPGALVPEAESPRPQVPTATPVVISAVPRRAVTDSGQSGKASQPTRRDISEPQKLEGAAPQALPTLANASPRAASSRSPLAPLPATSGTERDAPQPVVAPKQALPAAAQPVPQTPAQTTATQPAIQADLPAPAMPHDPAIAPAMDSTAIARLVDQLAAAREAFAPAQAQISLDHAEFGEIDLRFSQARGGELQIEIAAEDPALPHALAAAQPGEQAGSFRQGDSQPQHQPRMVGNAERDMSGSAGEGRAREDARRDQPARQQRQSHSDTGRDGTPPRGTYA